MSSDHQRRRYAITSWIGRRLTRQYQPLSSFKILLTKPEITLMFIFTSLLYAEFYCILYESSTPPKSRSLMIRTVLSTVLEDKYNLTELQIGLCYLYVPHTYHSFGGLTRRPSGIGAILSSYLNGLQQDHYYRKEITRAGGDYRKVGEEFRLEWTRFRCLLPFAMLVQLMPEMVVQ